MKNILNNIKNELRTLPNYETTEMEPRLFDKKSIRKQVYEELSYHLKGHKASKLLIRQLIELYGNGYVTILEKKHPYDRFDIYTSIEGIISGREEERPFHNPLLKNKNIYHAHHSHSFYINYNFMEHFSNKYKTDDDINRRLKQIKKRNPKNKDTVPVLLNEALLESVGKKKKTGQWIVYQRCDSKINFICLYLHNENDKQLYKFIRRYIVRKYNSILIPLFFIIVFIIIVIILGNAF